MRTANIPISPEQLVRFYRAAEIFTPSAPIDSQELFAGRVEQIHRAITADAERGKHVILYGERGVGKTSLANIVHQIVQQVSSQSVSSVVVNCDGIDDFDSLWKKIFSETPDLSSIDLTKEEITPERIRYLLQKNSNKLIIVIDELDRVQNSLATELLADTIKSLSDHSVNTTLILVGVADSVNDLISYHASVERALEQILMPRMSLEELFELLDKRLPILDMTIDEEARVRIALLSQGLPSYNHLLALHASQSAICQNSSHISLEHLDHAVELSTAKTQQSIINTYLKSTSSSRETIYSQVLLACALAQKDPLGRFSASDVRDPISQIMKKPYQISYFAKHLNHFCEAKRGPILQISGTERNYKYRFINPLMRPYVIMHGLNSNLITYDQIKNIY